MSGSVQVVVLLPLLLGIFLLLSQWALVAWAEATALAAAQQGASNASRWGSDGRAGQAAAREVAANGSLADVRVQVTRGSAHTTVTVEGTAVALVWQRSVSATVVVPSERLTRG